MIVMNEFIKRKARSFRKQVFKRLLPLRVKKMKRSGNKDIVKVIFIAQYPEMWNSNRSVYEFMKKDKRFEVNVLAVPKKRGEVGKSLVFFEENEMYSFLKEKGEPVINAYQSGGWKDIESLKPNYIFLQRPYDYFMPNCYSQYKLSKLALLCYIPYGYQFVKGVHMDIEYNDSLLNNMYFSFVDNSESYIYVEEKSKYLIKHKSRKVVDTGYPRFDLLKGISVERRAPKTFLWLPRWSVDAKNDKSGFFDYFESLIDFFSCREQCNLIIRPHPLMFDNFIKTGLLTDEQVMEIKDRVDKMRNVCFDLNVDYVETFKNCDALIADFTSLMIEFFVLKKPIVYCGETQEFNGIGKRMLEGMYCVSDWRELEDAIEILIEGDNIKESIYSDIADEIVCGDACIGELIANEVYADFKER